MKPDNNPVCGDWLDTVEINNPAGEMSPSDAELFIYTMDWEEAIFANNPTARWTWYPSNPLG